ncbi:TPA: helix-turn-helix domain-containing protein [Bacillus toyonensis]|nr:helix-turn-helix domain-containing protein [Bacillus toyonensis]
MLKKNEKGLSVIQQKAIQLIIMKDVTGKTMNDIADELGVDRSTIYDWQYKNPRFIEELNVQAEKVMDSFLVDCYGVLQEIVFDKKQSTKDRLSAIDKVLKIKGKYVDKVEIDDKSKGVTPVQQHQMKLELDILSQELLQKGLVTQEQLQEISFIHAGRIEGQLNELETIKLENELIG